MSCTVSDQGKEGPIGVKHLVDLETVSMSFINTYV